MDQQIAYLQVSAHWMHCPTCSANGGEAADPNRMCAIGRRLTRVWREAERRDAEAFDVRDISVRQWAKVVVWVAVGAGAVWFLASAVNVLRG